MNSQAGTLDLTDCDKEPIHIPGSIQPHGLLVVLKADTLRVTQMAGDTENLLGKEMAELLGKPVEAVVGAELRDALVSLEADSPEPLYVGSLHLPGRQVTSLDVTRHYRKGLLILELEPSATSNLSATEAIGHIRRILVSWEEAGTLQELYDASCKSLRILTGFDRVMIYRFLEDDTGVVIAEHKADDLDALVNHHYPASDIPKQARALYLKNPIRLIADADYKPAQLFPIVDPVSGSQLDMSECSLRSVSPIHVQYLKNLNVAASMSISIIVDGRLWGLVSCHHTSARFVPYELRETCRLLGRILSQMIKALQDAARSAQSERLAAARERLLRNLANVDSVENGVAEYLKDMQQLVQADGAALIRHGKLSQTGSTPSEDQTRELVQWLLDNTRSPIFATSSLSNDHEPAKAYSIQASGLLAAVIAHSGPFVLLWFRAEHVETINWAGNPHKPIEPGSEPGQLTPRKSFEDWKETVRNKANPWSESEIDCARLFGRAIHDMRTQHILTEMNLQLQKTLAVKQALAERK